jgi:6-pyruvoyltetrahydropterin/6-carboxytetrahydropterin synthase
LEDYNEGQIIMVVIKTEAAFEAAHRQLGDPGKCGSLHGHNWVVEFVLGGIVTNNLGYLIDFKDLKEMVDRFDHRVLLIEDDPLAAILESNEQRVYRLPLNPTCENIAKLLLDEIHMRTHNQVVDFISVTVWENDKSMATEQWSKEKEI